MPPAGYAYTAAGLPLLYTRFRSAAYRAPPVRLPFVQFTTFTHTCVYRLRSFTVICYTHALRRFYRLRLPAVLPLRLLRFTAVATRGLRTFAARSYTLHCPLHVRGCGWFTYARLPFCGWLRTVAHTRFAFAAAPRLLQLVCSHAPFYVTPYVLRAVPFLCGWFRFFVRFTVLLPAPARLRAAFTRSHAVHAGLPAITHGCYRLPATVYLPARLPHLHVTGLPAGSGLVGYYARLRTLYLPHTPYPVLYYLPFLHLVTRLGSPFGCHCTVTALRAGYRFCGSGLHTFVTHTPATFTFTYRLLRWFRFVLYGLLVWFTCRLRFRLVAWLPRILLVPHVTHTRLPHTVPPTTRSAHGCGCSLDWFTVTTFGLPPRLPLQVTVTTVIPGLPRGLRLRFHRLRFWLLPFTAHHRLYTFPVVGLPVTVRFCRLVTTHWLHVVTFTTVTTFTFYGSVTTRYRLLPPRLRFTAAAALCRGYTYTPARVAVPTFTFTTCTTTFRLRTFVRLPTVVPAVTGYVLHVQFYHTQLHYQFLFGSVPRCYGYGSAPDGSVTALPAGLHAWPAGFCTVTFTVLHAVLRLVGLPAVTPFTTHGLRFTHYTHCTRYTAVMPFGSFPIPAVTCPVRIAVLRLRLQFITLHRLHRRLRVHLPLHTLTRLLQLHLTLPARIAHIYGYCGSHCAHAGSVTRLVPHHYLRSLPFILIPTLVAVLPLHVTCRTVVPHIRVLRLRLVLRLRRLHAIRLRYTAVTAVTGHYTLRSRSLRFWLVTGLRYAHTFTFAHYTTHLYATVWLLRFWFLSYVYGSTYTGWVHVLPLVRLPHTFSSRITLHTTAPTLHTVLHLPAPRCYRAPYYRTYLPRSGSVLYGCWFSSRFTIRPLHGSSAFSLFTVRLHTFCLPHAPHAVALPFVHILFTFYATHVVPGPVYGYGSVACGLRGLRFAIRFAHTVRVQFTLRIYGSAVIPLPTVTTVVYAHTLRLHTAAVYILVATRRSTLATTRFTFTRSFCLVQFTPRFCTHCTHHGCVYLPHGSRYGYGLRGSVPVGSRIHIAVYTAGYAYGYTYAAHTLPRILRYNRCYVTDLPLRYTPTHLYLYRLYTHHTICRDAHTHLRSIYTTHTVCLRLVYAFAYVTTRYTRCAFYAQHAVYTFFAVTFTRTHTAPVTFTAAVVPRSRARGLLPATRFTRFVGSTRTRLRTPATLHIYGSAFRSAVPHYTPGYAFTFAITVARSHYVLAVTFGSHLRSRCAVVRTTQFAVTGYAWFMRLRLVSFVYTGCWLPWLLATHFYHGCNTTGSPRLLPLLRLRTLLRFLHWLHAHFAHARFVCLVTFRLPAVTRYL